RDYRNYKWRIRRQREIRNRILLLAFTVCLVLVMAVSYYSITSYAESEIGNMSFKYYTDIQVEYGDSLWSIAREYCDSHYDNIFDYMNEVRSINHIKGDTIREGQMLIVPYYSNEYK
ncbi:MAG: LysM peptidoglycan-binding domain-containing protein, partial [Lachnospiraceae bacterium]|nr:LysM peptidoglycan-binding domain-containing protein [Lachnospiraceae bacterium]